MKILNVEQGSDEWKLARVGKVTASRMADVCAKTKSGWGASRANYAAELITERLTLTPAERFVNDAMKWGTEHEAEARLRYELMSNVDVQQVGLVCHPTIEMSLASPDGLVGTDGLVEIKCPNSATHIEILLSESVPDRYVKQMLWQMECCERSWCDFVSYDPRLPLNMQMFTTRVHRDETALRELRSATASLLDEISDKIDRLNAKFAQMEAA